MILYSNMLARNINALDSGIYLVKNYLFRIQHSDSYYSYSSSHSHKDLFNTIRKIIYSISSISIFSWRWWWLRILIFAFLTYLLLVKQLIFYSLILAVLFDIFFDNARVLFRVEYSVSSIWNVFFLDNFLNMLSNLEFDVAIFLFMSNYMCICYTFLYILCTTLYIKEDLCNYIFCIMYFVSVMFRFLLEVIFFFYLIMYDFRYIVLLLCYVFYRLC